MYEYSEFTLKNYDCNSGHRVLQAEKVSNIVLRDYAKPLVQDVWWVLQDFIATAQKFDCWKEIVNWNMY